MERINIKQHAKSSPPAMTNDSNNDGPNAVNDGNAADKGPQCLVREQDQYMPIANVIRIMRRILPPHAKISDDAKETIQECVSEYIAFVTGEANERCQREQRKTVTAEDVLWAMGKLGFDNYVEPLTVFLHKYRESENGERSSLRGDYAKRERMDYGPAGPQMAIVPPPPYGPGFPMGPHGHPMFDPSMVGLLRDGSSSGAGGGGGSSSSEVVRGFDPFASFK